MAWEELLRWQAAEAFEPHVCACLHAFMPLAGHALPS